MPKSTPLLLVAQVVTHRGLAIEDLVVVNGAIEQVAVAVRMSCAAWQANDTAPHGFNRHLLAIPRGLVVAEGRRVRQAASPVPGSAQGDRAVSHGFLVVERISVEAIDGYRRRLIQDRDDAGIGRSLVAQQLQIQFQRCRLRPAPIDGRVDVPAILLNEIAKTLRRQSGAVQPVKHSSLAVERTGRRKPGADVAIASRAQVQLARGGCRRLGA